ncbi:unnamed protein product, partial [Rotaria sp. Silwood1]
MDSGYFKFRMNLSCLTNPLHFDENTLDSDVLAERRRVLNLNHTATNKNLLNADNNEEGHDTDHL